MTEFGSKARRLLLAGAIAFATGAPTIACMGGDGGTTDAAGDDDDDDGGGKEESGGIEDGLIGSFQVQPSPEMLRELKILNAAVNGRPPPKNIKPPMGPDDKKMFREAKQASGGEKEYIKGQIKLMKGARVTFKSDGSGKYDFDGGNNPFKYTLSGASGNTAKITMNYDHGTVEKANLTLKGSDVHAEFTSPRATSIVFKRK